MPLPLLAACVTGRSHDISSEEMPLIKTVNKTEKSRKFTLLPYAEVQFYA